MSVKRELIKSNLTELFMSLMILMAYYSAVFLVSAVFSSLFPDSFSAVMLDAVGMAGGLILLLLLPDRNGLLFRKQCMKWHIILLVIFASIVLSISLNLLADTLQAAQYSPAFRSTVSNQNQAGLLAGILIFGILAPITEELLFRGYLYQRLKKVMKVPYAMVLASLIFAVAHGNIVQGVYAFLMGMFIVILYEKTQNFAFAVLFHAIANLTTLLM